MDHAVLVCIMDNRESASSTMVELTCQGMGSGAIPLNGNVLESIDSDTSIMFDITLVTRTQESHNAQIGQ